MNKRILLYTAAAFFLFGAIAAWRMLMLYGQDELWGHWPLPLFGSFWMSGLLVILSMRKDITQHTRWFILSMLSVTLLSVGFPPMPTTFVLAFAFVPLFFIEREINESSTIKKPTRTTLFYAYAIFSGWNILTTYWVANTALVAGVFAIMANSMLMLLPFLMFILFRRYAGDRTAYWTFVVFWILFEYGHMRWEVTWPWLTLGNALSQYSWLPQWYEYTGVFGGTLWILMLNVLIYSLIRLRNQTGIWQLKGLFIIGFWLLTPMVLSLVMYLRHTENGREVEVAIVQPNYEPHYEKFTIPELEQLQRFMKLSSKIVRDSTAYLLFPETSFDYIDLDRVNEQFPIRSIKEIQDDFPQCEIVLGVSAHRLFSNKPLISTNVREFNRGGETVYWEAYNAAIQISPTNDSVQTYLKSRLVPGPEIFPYKDYLFFFKPIIDKLDGTIEGLGTQPERSNFVSKHGSVAPVICYESIFGEYVGAYINKGAEAIFIMTNDGWWDNTPGHIQHLKFGSIRAIETRRSIARSANSGISCFINQRGDILQPSGYNVEDSFRGTIRMNDQITFYTKWGDIIGRLSLFIAFFQILYLIFGWIKKRYKVL